MTEHNERLHQVAQQLVSDGIEPNLPAALRAAAVVLAASELIARQDAAASDQQRNRAS
jgi:hypothetical protein